MDVIDNLVKRATRDFAIQLDELMIKGLQLKGYPMDGTRAENQEFIRQNCEVHIHPDGSKVFFVGESSFLLYTPTDPKQLGGWRHGKNKVTAIYDMGAYSYL